MEFITPTTFRVMFGRATDTKTFSAPLNIKTKYEPTARDFTRMLGNLIFQNKLFFAVSLFFLCGWIYVQVDLLFHRISKIINDISKSEAHIASIPSKFLEYGIPQNEESDDYEFDSIAKIFHYVASLSVLTTLIIFFIPSFSNISKYSKLTYLEASHLSLHHYDTRKINNETLVNKSRYFLPPGRMWLDERLYPEFPAVHSGIKAYCAYNKYSQKCLNFNPAPQKPVAKLPNVVFLLFESLTPIFPLFSKDFITEHVNAKEGSRKRIFSSKPFINPMSFPGLGKYQELGVAFSGMSALGSPSDYGWHSLMTGIPPSQSFSNMQDGFNIHSDDLPSFLHSGGYKTLYFSGKPIDSSHEKYWVWRRTAREEALYNLNCHNLTKDMNDDIIYLRHKLRHCNEREIKSMTESLDGIDFPTWFDKTYKISPDNIKDLDIDQDDYPKEIKNEIYPDRIVAEQFISKWPKKSHQPIFAVFEGVETSQPYNGFDDELFYEPYDQDLNSMSSEYRLQRFVQMMKYSDKYQIGRVLDFLSQTDNNTIFVITGKSGMNDVPVMKSGHDYGDGVIYAKDCVGGSSGTDSFFTTSAIIGYLGNDENIKNILHLTNISGKTLKLPTDHNDLIYTLEDILSKINGTELPPTHRRSRNLLDLTNDIVSKNKNVYKNIEDWRSYSLTTFLADYREGVSLLKTHTGDPNGAHYYEIGSFPTCLRKNTSEPIKVGSNEGKIMYDRMLKFIKMENYLTSSNRLYNYAFRDVSCIEKGQCTYPTLKEIEINDRFFVGGMMILPLVLVGLISILLNVMVVLAPLCNIGKHTSISRRRQSFYEI